MPMKKGLSLIELLVALVILAILAKIAIPAFQNIDMVAKDATVKAALGEMRAAIQAYSAAEIVAGRANRFASGAAGGWPTTGQINEAKYGGTNVVLQSRDVPENPFAKEVFSQNFDRVIFNGGPRGSLSAIMGESWGWYYNESTGDIWAGTSVNGENLY